MAFLLLLIFQVSPPFWSYWGDGKAEINSYSIIQNLYNQPRKATSVMIYVTEPFNLAKQVKSDVSNDKDPNIISVMKLNRTKKFQTGIYDYSLLSSVFVPVNTYSIGKSRYSSGSPLKISFSSQEWCGLTTHQLNRTEQGMNSRQLSYFESEGDKLEQWKSDDKTLYADNLFIAVRELLAPLPAGTYPYYQTLEFGRLFHSPFVQQTAVVEKKDGTLSRENKTTSITHWTITAGKQVWTFDVEKEYSRRILEYQFSDGDTVIETGKLLKSKRLPYWQLNKNGDESYHKELGL
jgi:hypothetical protein